MIRPRCPVLDLMRKARPASRSATIPPSIEHCTPRRRRDSISVNRNLGSRGGTFATIWRLAIRRVLVDTAEFKSFNIQDLTVTRLRAAGVNVSDSLKLPRSNVLMKMPLSSIVRGRLQSLGKIAPLESLSPKREGASPHRWYRKIPRTRNRRCSQIIHIVRRQNQTHAKEK